MVNMKEIKIVKKILGVIILISMLLWGVNLIPGFDTVEIICYGRYEILKTPMLSIFTHSSSFGQWNLHTTIDKYKIIRNKVYLKKGDDLILIEFFWWGWGYYDSVWIYSNNNRWKTYFTKNSNMNNVHLISSIEDFVEMDRRVFKDMNGNS